MFLVFLVFTLLCYKPASSQAPKNRILFSEIQRWNKQVAMDAYRDGFDKFVFTLYIETNTFFDMLSLDRYRGKIRCGEILNKTDQIWTKPRVFLDIQSLGLIKWETIVGIEIPGKPLQCKSIVGLGPLNDFLKSIDKGNYYSNGYDIFHIVQLETLELSMQAKLRSVYEEMDPALRIEYEDIANCRLRLTEREWISITIACVVLALCINEIVLSRLMKERIRIHNPVSKTLKLPN